MTRHAMRLHDRDYGLLAELGEVGVLDTPTLARRHFPLDTSGEACRRRLRLYALHGLIASSAHPLSYGRKHGGRPRAIHRLTPFGADTLCAATGTTARRVARAEPLKPDTLLHRLGIAAVHLAVLDACSEHHLPVPQWILEQDTTPAAAPDAPFTERFVLYELFRPTETSTISCRPDASTWLRIPGSKPEAWLDLLAYWEFDRATETLARVARKLDGYRLLLQTATYRRHWPGAVNAPVRIFFVLPSDERLRHVVATIRQHPAAEVVRLTTASRLIPSRLLTEPIWETVTGETRRLWTPAVPASRVPLRS